ncbi:MAG: sigma-E factor negative regulatory protein [Gammaproteobacteria bacterium]
MKKAKLEQLSSLVDNHYDGEPQGPVNALLKDPQLRASWQRYHEIGDWMRGVADGEVVHIDVANRVRSALEAEPALLFPAHRKVNSEEPPQSRRWTQIAGMGMAAAVATVTVLLVQQLVPAAGEDGPVIAVNESAVGTRPVAVAASKSLPLNADSSPQDASSAEDFQRKLDAYLASHVKQSAGHRTEGFLPPATVVDFSQPAPNR